jgi:hypothetical protein
MRPIRAAVLGLLLAGSALFAADPRDCLQLSASEDTDVHSPSGVRVTINGYNRCSEDLNGNDCRFRVEAIGPSGNVIASQSGRFGGSVGPGARVETKVFVVCDPERVRSVRVVAR